MPRTMKHQAALLLRRLGLDKSHISSGDGLADCLSVGGIVLLPLDVRLDVAAASGGPYAQAPAIAGTSDAMWRRPLCRSGTAVPSQRRQVHTAASVYDEVNALHLKH